MKNNWIKLFGHFVNASQITHINMLVYGRDCGAPFERQDEKFLVIVLSCGQRYRVAHSDPDTEELLKKLGFDLV